MSRVRSLVGVLLLVALAAPVAVAARSPVDPNTLNPPPPDFFNAECNLTGVQTICTLAFSDDPIMDEPSGVVCDGTELLLSQERSVVGKRFYDGDGNLTRRHFREDFSGSITNPLTDASVLFIGTDTVVHNLVVPGDLLTGTVSTTGLNTRVFAPGGGTILREVGRFFIDAATDTVTGDRGPHPFIDYFVHGDASALDSLCDAVEL